MSHLYLIDIVGKLKTSTPTSLASLLSLQLTCSNAEPQAAQQVAGQPVSVPDGELHAGLSQIRVSDPVVHHGVVEHGVDRPAQHTRLLSTLPAGVWQHEAGERGRAENLI